MAESKLVKRNVKDSVFTNLFQHPKYVAQLYEALHPEVGVVPEDRIEIVTLKNILNNPRPYVSCPDLSGLYRK